ncbi:MAG: hypothetical protein AB1744_08615 [Candidatus Zixiibacteriota bacterium]
MAIYNHGLFGEAPSNAALAPDAITGQPILYGSEFPKGSRRNYLRSSGLWVGGILDGDTLVTTVMIAEVTIESTPTWVNGTCLAGRTSFDSLDLKYRGAVSEQDRIVMYTDTVVYHEPWFYDYLDYRPHRPLWIKFTQESYAWSYTYAQDIVFFNVLIRNIGNNPIRNCYVGLAVLAMPRYDPSPGEFGAFTDDVCGFLNEFPSGSQCGYMDTLNIAWGADNDGDPYQGEWVEEPVYNASTGTYVASVQGVVGFRVLSPSSSSILQSFNWWTGYTDPGYDYGPQRTASFRQFPDGTGWPLGDRNRYHMLRNGEIDFPSFFTANIALTGTPGWVQPPLHLAPDVADGTNLFLLLSYGPFDIGPGESLPFPFAVFCAENFHLYPNNGENLPYEPRRWLANVDFSGLAKNAVWAQKIYDNPGVDTDGDGYAGEYRVCNLDSIFTGGEWVYTVADTEWYKGDGIPDWRAAGPPPAPHFWLTPILNGLQVRINGQATETARDVMTQQIDFEGYNIYLGRDEREGSLALIASYDREDYDKYVFNATSGQWELPESPFTLEELRCLYGDSCNDSTFDPLRFSPTYAYQHPLYPDSLFYFTKHGYNASESGVSTPIRKTYPDMTDPSNLPADSLHDTLYTEDGYLKYYEYEFEIHDLLPSVPYWVNVTAFDFGSPESGLLQPLETKKTLGVKEGFPLHSLDAPISGSGKIYVYPNPYRIDARYRLYGYEGRTREEMPDDKVRALHFGNLPPRCTIKIFTLDGDRLITIEHDKDPSDPTVHHNSWNLITRNHQRPVSGLYYWTVETPDGQTQIGKFAIIM